MELDLSLTFYGPIIFYQGGGTGETVEYFYLEVFMYEFKDQDSL